MEQRNEAESLMGKSGSLSVDDVDDGDYDNKTLIFRGTTMMMIIRL